MKMTLSAAAALLGVHAGEELLALAGSPNGARGRELAVLLRDHPQGGLEATVEVAEEVARLMGLNPRSPEGLRARIRALPGDLPETELSHESVVSLLATVEAELGRGEINGVFEADLRRLATSLERVRAYL